MSRPKGTVKEHAFWTTDKPGETWTNVAEQTVPKKSRDFTRLIFFLVERYRRITILSKYTTRKFTVSRTFYDFARNQFIFLYLGIVFFITIIILRLKCICLLFFSCFSVLSDIRKNYRIRSWEFLPFFLFLFPIFLTSGYSLSNRWSSTVDTVYHLCHWKFCKKFESLVKSVSLSLRITLFCVSLKRRFYRVT